MMMQRVWWSFQKYRVSGWQSAEDFP
jgi:hypothetical protein